MKTNRKYSYSVNALADLYKEMQTKSEVQTATVDMVEQIIVACFNKLATVEDLREVAQAVVTNIRDLGNIRMKEVAPSGNGTKTVSISATKTDTKPAKGNGTTKANTPAKAATETKPKAKSETKKAEKEEVKQVKIASLSKDDIKKMGVRFLQYSEKCVSLTGETKSIKEDIKRIAGGHWNHSRQCWFLKNDKGHELAKLMGQKVYKKAE